MIEYRPKHPSLSSEWQKIKHASVPSEINFNYVNVRINGVVYLKRSEAFIKAFGNEISKERMWKKLSD